jgi:hypothetical protein
MDHQKKSNNFQASKQAATAEQNRQHQAGLEIVQALQRLGIPDPQWPELVRAYYRSSPQRIASRQRISPRAFRPPPFDRLNESPEEW